MRASLRARHATMREELHCATHTWTCPQGEGTHVRAVAVCPGYTRTEFHARAGINMGSISDPLWLDPDDVVSQALRDARAGRIVSVAGWQYKALSVLLGVLPRPVIRLVGQSGQIGARFGRDR